MTTGRKIAVVAVGGNALIRAKGYEHFFLTVEDIVRWAREGH